MNEGIARILCVDDEPLNLSLLAAMLFPWGYDAAGDEVLKYLSAILSNNARESDIICRYGGEEFLVALPGMSFDNALQRVESCRIIFSEQPAYSG